METKNIRAIYIIILIFSFFAGMSLIYFTPLKYSQLREPKIKDIGAKDVYEKMLSEPEKFDFIDVRGSGAYGDLHAKGSRSVPLHTLYFERKNLPKKDKTIVLICSGGVASGVGYIYLEHYGFRNIIRVDGGIESWITVGLPTESGLK